MEFCVDYCKQEMYALLWSGWSGEMDMHGNTRNYMHRESKDLQDQYVVQFCMQSKWFRNKCSMISIDDSSCTRQSK